MTRALLAALLLAAAPAAADEPDRYEAMGALFARLSGAAVSCGFGIDEPAFVAWHAARVPPEARAAFRAGHARAADALLQAAAAETLAAIDAIAAGRDPPPPADRRCPEARATADTLGWLAPED